MNCRVVSGQLLQAPHMHQILPSGESGAAQPGLQCQMSIRFFALQHDVHTLKIVRGLVCMFPALRSSRLTSAGLHIDSDQEITKGMHSPAKQKKQRSLLRSPPIVDPDSAYKAEKMQTPLGLQCNQQ